MRLITANRLPFIIANRPRDWFAFYGAVLVGSKREELSTISIVDQPEKKEKKAFVASVTCVS
jgi:hypothetical protein